MSGHYGKMVLHELMVENGMMQFKERKTILMKSLDVEFNWKCIRSWILSWVFQYVIIDIFLLNMRLIVLSRSTIDLTVLCNPNNPNDIYKKLEKKLFVFLSNFVFKGQCFN